MAYINTHLIVKPKPNWLSTGTINKRINTHPQNIKTHNLVSYFFTKSHSKNNHTSHNHSNCPKFQFYIMPYKEFKNIFYPPKWALYAVINTSRKHVIRQFAQNIHQYQTKIYVILLILIKKRILISSNNPINQFYPHRQKQCSLN